MPDIAENRIVFDLYENMKSSLNDGYRIYLSQKYHSSIKNSIILIHNGLELLFKLYLKTKNEYLIFDQYDHNLFLDACADNLLDDSVKQKVQSKVKHNTISFSKCVELLSHFMEISIPDIDKLNKIRNKCVHYEFTIYKNEIMILLISKIYPLVKKILNELSIEINSVIKDTISLDKWCDKIHDHIQSQYLQKIASAKKHYENDLNEKDRQEKQTHENYTQCGNSKLVTCPACQNNSLLEFKTTRSLHEEDFVKTVTKNIILKSLSCHHCGLNICSRDMLLLNFSDYESTTTSSTTNINSPYYFDNSSINFDCMEDCMEDCMPTDCMEDCVEDCMPTDCMEDCIEDCMPTDCMEDCVEDCVPTDCMEDCVEDCIPTDCPDE